MSILEKEVWVGLGGSALKHYEKLGYDIPKIKNKSYRVIVPIGTKIKVSIRDLMVNSQAEVTKVCDSCFKKIENQQYGKIIKQRKKGDGVDRCSECTRVLNGINRKYNKIYESSLEHYAITSGKEYLLREFSEKNERSPIEISYGTNTLYWWMCFDCKSEYDMSVKNRCRGESCPYCAGKRINSTNCLATTHPEVVALLSNEKEGTEILSGSHKSKCFKCKDCGNIELRGVDSVVRRGFSCQRCSDGLSYPEKIMYNILQQLDIYFKKEESFDWSKNIECSNSKLNGDKRYDFFIPSMNTIIEVHGAQHYSRSFGNGNKSTEEEKENDTLKEHIAKNNGIKNYIVIDCAKSELPYMKQNIIDSKLSEMLKLNEIDWFACHEKSCSSFVKIACDYWNEGLHSTTQIGLKMKLHKDTICSYLKKGNTLKWCNYQPTKSKKIVQLSTKGIYIKDWGNGEDARKSLGLRHIHDVCRGKRKTDGGFKWMYKEDYDRYIEQNAYLS